MKQRQKEKGIAHLGLIVAMVVVIAAVVFGGWYVWQKNKDDKQANGSNNSSQTNNDQNSQNEEPSDPSEDGKYLVISEWGVRFKLPTNMWGDVQYGIATSRGTNEQTTSFEIGRIARLPGSNCTLREVNDQASTGKVGGIGVLIVRSTIQKTTQQEAQYQSASQLGEYWYYIAGMRDGCLPVTGTDADAENTELMVQAADSLKDALKGLELVQ